MYGAWFSDNPCTFGWELALWLFGDKQADQPTNLTESSIFILSVLKPQPNMLNWLLEYSDHFPQVAIV